MNQAAAVLSPLAYHVLLALARGPAYGYAIKQTITDDSRGALRPGAGSLYRLIAKLIAGGMVEEVDAPDNVEAHPGLARKYYGLTAHGERALTEETERLGAVMTIAGERLAEDGKP